MQPVRFLCDEMLARLGRWLRAAGYDVVIAESGAADKLLLQLAQEEERIFLTRDHRLQEQHGTRCDITLLTSNYLAGQLREVATQHAINWTYKPFSRCMECNTVLVPAEASVVKRVPVDSMRQDSRVLYCPRCDKPYWFGSHAKRMRMRLEQLSRGEWDGVVD